MRILAVGIATLDFVTEVERYPVEDEEMRALAYRQMRGGNATNTLVVLSQLGHSCHWAGVLPSEPGSGIVLEDLARYGVSVDLCDYQEEGRIPVSLVTLSRATGSRTIVHYRDLQEYSYEAFDRIDLGAFDWVHFEGRNVDQLDCMLRKVKAQGGIACSLEVEKPRDDIESLFDLPDILLFSKHYAMHCGRVDPESFFARSLPRNKDIYLSWGEAGAMVRDKRGNLYSSPAFAPEMVCDTLGAGDVFNAAVIHGYSKQEPVGKVLQEAARMAGRKCGMHGLDLGLEDAN